MIVPYEPRHDKACIQGLRPVKTQTGLLSYRLETSKRLEILDIPSRVIILSRQRTTKALISLRIQLICAFVVRIWHKQVFSWRGSFSTEMRPKDANGMANRIDPRLDCSWSGSTLFAQSCPSESYGTLRLVLLYCTRTCMIRGPQCIAWYVVRIGGWSTSACICQLQMSRAMRKCVFCHMRTTKAQISLRIRAVWSAPLLFAA